MKPPSSYDARARDRHIATVVVALVISITLVFSGTVSAAESHQPGQIRPDVNEISTINANGGPAGMQVEQGGNSSPQSSAHAPALAFTDTGEYRVPVYVRVRHRQSTDDVDGERKFNANGEPYLNDAFFAIVGVDRRGDSSSALKYSIEDQEEAKRYTICQSQTHTTLVASCRDALVDIVPNTGRISLRFDEGKAQLSYVNDYTRRKLELSIADDSVGRKIFREMYLGPPETPVDCGDFPDATPQKFTCLFLPELHPDGLESMSQGLDVEALRANLPAMVQDRDNYRLLFAEEFVGGDPAPEASGCRDSLSSLDLEMWAAYNSCLRVDSRNQPCTDISEGHLLLGLSNTCSAKLRTLGRFHVKYGYIEMKYTVDLLPTRWHYTNAHAVLSGLNNKLHYHWDNYGVEADNIEEYLRNSESEIDFIEYVQNSRSTVAHQYLNWYFEAENADIVPTRTSKEVRFCGWMRDRIVAGFNCNRWATSTATVTIGMEWTPQGYVNHIKIDGVHDNMIQLPKNVIRIEYKPVVRLPSGKLGPQGWSHRTGADHDRYFDYMESGDTGTRLLLEQAVVAHVPLPFGFGVSGRHPNLRIEDWLKVDYLRVWQPENSYSDMEPVYQ